MLMIIYKFEKIFRTTFYSQQVNLLILLYEIPPGGQRNVHQYVVVISV